MSRHPGKPTDEEQDSAAEAFYDAVHDAETWNTCPECFNRWKETVAIPGVVHRTKVCVLCAARLKAEAVKNS